MTLTLWTRTVVAARRRPARRKYQAHLIQARLIFRAELARCQVAGCSKGGRGCSRCGGCQADLPANPPLGAADAWSARMFQFGV